jgi:hypothetical protein
LAAVTPPVEKLAPENGSRVSSEDEVMTIHKKARLSLEVVDDMVEMLVTTGSGQRRVLSRQEQALLSVLSERPSLSKLREQARHYGGADEFLDELLGAGVLVAV